MRMFKIILSGYGGEVTIGRVSHAFHDYWKAKEDSDDECDVKYHIHALDFGDDDFDPNSPPMTDGGNKPWHEIDDIEHANGIYADNGYTVVEVDSDGNVIGDEFSYDFNAVTCREAYAETEENIMKINQVLEAFPVMTYHTSEKGYFGDILIETMKDFDPNLFEVSILETNCCQIVEAFRYDKKQLEVTQDWYESRGITDCLDLNLFVKQWHDPQIIWPDEE